MLTKLPLVAALAAAAMTTAAAPAAQARTVVQPSVRPHVQAHVQPVRIHQIPGIGGVYLNNDDNGATMTAHPGDIVIVALAGRDDTRVDWRWSAPTSADPAVLKDLGSGTISRYSLAIFHAEHDGTTTLMSTETCVGHLGVMCPMVATPWKVTITVQ